MPDPTTILRAGDALLIVDVQNSFCPGGELPIEHGDEVVPELNRWIARAAELGLSIYFSRDFHPSRHPSFASRGGQWPDHCVEGTPGADFHADLTVPPGLTVVTKGTRFDKDQYSAFDGTGLAQLLRSDGVQRLFVGGLALDVCVRATVLDSVAAGFPTHLIVRGSRPVTREGGLEALAEMEAAGAVLEK